ncbi:MAG: hypothetical protein KAJ01_05755, partial [Candidatus Hydrogenedentes bacterium]|nr:hypothetical protein [Candidatus Hydrogenedentota bacterium]
MFETLGTMDSTSVVMILLDAACKGAFVLIIAAGAAALLRRRSAALRHAVWTVGILLALAMPLLSAMTPGLHIPLPLAESPQAQPGHSTPTDMSTGFQTPITSIDAPAEMSNPLHPAPGVSNLPPTVASSATANPDEQPLPAQQADSVHWSVWVLGVWAIGALIVAAPLLVGMVGIRVAARKVRRVTNPRILALLERTCNELKIRDTIALRETDRSLIPIMWGFIRPMLLIPTLAEAWSDERMRMVLLHELAHVKRRDCPIQFLSQLVRAVYWFNPLAWWVCRRLRVEQERACDDLVLRCGPKPSDYAGHLVDIVRSLRSGAFCPLGAVAMAQKGGFETRIRTILDATRRRGTLGRFGKLGIVAISLTLAIPLAALRPVIQAEQTQKDVAKAEDHIRQSRKKISGAKLAKIVKEAVLTISTCAETDPRVKISLASLKGLNEQAVVKAVAKFLDSEKNTVRRSAIYILWKGDFTDITPAVTGLMKLCKHKEGLTRGMAALALGGCKIDSSFQTLCEMTLKDQ